MPAFLFVKYEIIILKKNSFNSSNSWFQKNEWLSKYKDNDENKVYNHERAGSAIGADQLL